MSFGMQVSLTHSQLGKVFLRNVTEIHWKFPSPMGSQVAFESDIQQTGCTYFTDQILEFEVVCETSTQSSFNEPVDNLAQ